MKRLGVMFRIPNYSSIRVPPIASSGKEELLLLSNVLFCYCVQVFNSVIKSKCAHQNIEKLYITHVFQDECFLPPRAPNTFMWRYSVNEFVSFPKMSLDSLFCSSYSVRTWTVVNLLVLQPEEEQNVKEKPIKLLGRSELLRCFGSVGFE